MPKEKMRFIPLSIFLMSFYLILLEIFLTRIFSVILFYHFAFMAISVALLGLGTSGMAIYFFPKFFSRERSPTVIVWSFLLFSMSIIIVLFAILVLKIPLAVNASVVFKLSILYLVMLLPFFFGGTVISLILSRFSENVSKLYFWDLIGASLGTLAVILLLKFFGGPNGLIFISLMGLVPAFLWGIHYKFKKTAGLAAIVGVIVLFMLVVGVATDAFALDYTKGADETVRQGDKEFSAWNTISRIDLFDRGETSKFIYIDSDALTAVAQFDGNLESVRQHTVEDNKFNALAYYLKPNSHALIIGAGGGGDVLRALMFNNTVTGVEINEIIVNDIMKDRLKEYSGRIYFRDDVNVVVDEARSYIRRSDEKYGVMQMALIDTWAATAAGAFSLTENNLYTVEAFEDYLTHLERDGVFTATRWTFAKPQETVRLAAIAAEALDNIGVANPEDHILLIKQKVETIDRLTPIEGVANLIVKRTPLTEEDVGKITEIADEEGYEILYNPFEVQDNQFDDLLRTSNKERFYDNYALDIVPSTDDRPFFFYTLRWSDSIDLFKLFSGEKEEGVTLKNNLGIFLLLITLFLTFALAVLFIIVPLIWARGKDLRSDKRNKFRILMYFAGIGLGFIITEIVLMQKFVLFLGHPIYSLGAILFSLLVFSGVGSFTTNNVDHKNAPKKAALNLIFLLSLILFYFYFLPAILDSFIIQPLIFRIVLSVLLLSPLGLLLGRFFPIGVKMIEKNNEEMIPWAWGVNGATSVVGSVFALILAINLGFAITLAVGVAFYMLTLVLILNRL